MLRKTYAEIDLNAIGNNINALKEKAGKDVKALLPVKADAYGHGIIDVSKYVEQNNIVDMLGVASLDEGVELRNAGVNLPILVLGLVVPDEDSINTIIDYNLTQTIADIVLAEKIWKIAKQKKKAANLHLKIDTGMGRIGCKPEDAINIVKAISNKEYLNLEGIYSHFPVADEDDPDFTLNQIEKFNLILDGIRSEGIDIPVKHISNSAGIVRFPESMFNMIRPGIMSYGYLPSSGMKIDIPLQPAMTLKSFIVFVKKVKKGVPLCYGLTYTTPAQSNIATVAIGYGDGYNRFLSNRGKVIINNKIYPVVGRVTMDQILVNLGDDEYSPGEEVILFGKQIITANTIADSIGTIPYEVTCAVSRRVPRIYIG